VKKIFFGVASNIGKKNEFTVKKYSLFLEKNEHLFSFFEREFCTFVKQSFISITTHSKARSTTRKTQLRLWQFFLKRKIRQK